VLNSFAANPQQQSPEEPDQERDTGGNFELIPFFGTKIGGQDGHMTLPLNFKGNEIDCQCRQAVCAAGLIRINLCAVKAPVADPVRPL
jgi:hypothetical protein